MHPREFLASAEKYYELGTGKKQPVHLRNCISRSYYAAFHLFDAWYNSLSPDEKAGGNSHEKVIRTLLNHSDECLNDQGKLLNTLKSRRNKADYILEHDVYPKIAKQQLSQADELMTEFEAWLASRNIQLQGVPAQANNQPAKAV